MWCDSNNRGIFAADYIAALDQYGEDIDLEIAAWGEQLISPEPRYEEFDARVRPAAFCEGPCDVEIYHAAPRFLAALADDCELLWKNEQDGPCRIAMTTWETSPIPDVYAYGLAKYDGVIVPSEFVHDLIGSHETTLTIPMIVPHCFDPDFWPASPQAGEPTRNFPFRFYSIGAWGERKNMLGLLRAYLHAFTSVDAVQLMLIVDRGDLDEIRSLVARSGIAECDLPEIIVPDKILSEGELVELHACADCFVSVTRGEGWGLGLFEAAVMGRHVIAPLWGGQADFLDNYAYARSVPYQLTPCFGTETRERVLASGQQEVQISRVSRPPGVDCKQVWAEPDLVALATEMRAVYENSTQDEGTLRTERAALEARFSYQAVGKMLTQTLQEIART